MRKQVVVDASEGHRILDMFLRRVYGADDHIVIEQDGSPVAVLLSYQEYRALQQAQDLGALEEMNRALSQEAERRHLTDADFLRELREVREEMFTERYGKTDSA